MAAEAPSETLSDRLIRSWARQRLVAASSRRTDEKVASRRGSGRHCRKASRARLLSLRLCLAVRKRDQDQVGCQPRHENKDLPKEAAHDVLEQAHRLLLDQLSDHITEYGAHSVETLICRTNIRQANIIEKNLLHNENGNGFAEFRPGLHDAKTEGNDLGGEEEVDHVRGVILHQRSNDAERCEAEVLKRTRFRGGVQKGIEEQGDVSCERPRGQGISLLILSRLAWISGEQLTVQEESAGLIVGCDALQERQRVADSI